MKKMRWYTFSKIVLWLLLVINISVFLSFVGIAQNELLCLSIHIEWDGEPTEKFLTDEELEMYIEDGLGTDHLVGQPLVQMNPEVLENIIMGNPYIRRATCYQDIQGNVFLKVWPRKAIARVLGSGQEGYYISEDAHKIPLSRRFTPRVPVITGYFFEGSTVKDTFISKEGKSLFYFVQTIQRDSFSSALISQIEVDQNGEFSVFNNLGNGRVFFGDTTDLSEKLYKLRVFYSKVLNIQGWNKYQYINLKFRNQVLATPFFATPKPQHNEHEG